MKALLAGASGLCGTELLHILLSSDNFDHIYILVRENIAIKHFRLTQIVTDYSNLERDLAGIDINYIYCCLGTTIKKAGSKEKFAKVDHIYVKHLADWGEKAGVKYFGVISAMGANSASKIFYNQVKGEMELDIIHHNIEHISIYRPSLLLGARKEKRIGEKVATIFMAIIKPIMSLFFKSYQAIPAKTVAKAMFYESLHVSPQKYTYLNKQLFVLSSI